MTRRKTIAFSTGKYSFISIGITLLLVTCLYLWGTFVSFREFVMANNANELKMLIAFFDQNIREYHSFLRSEVKQSVYTKAVMNPSEARYYINDQMENVDVQGLEGNLVLTTFDGVVIYSTGNNDDLSINAADIRMLIQAAEQGEIIIMLNSRDTVFISPVKYHDMNEGYLFFIVPFSEIYKANYYLIETLEQVKSIAVYYEDERIIDDNTSGDGISASYSFTSLPLSMEIVRSTAFIRQRIRNQLYSFITISLLTTIFLSFILGMLVSHKISIPLRSLKNGIQRVSEGMWEELQLNGSSPREILFLTNEFNRMQKSIRSKNNELEVMNKELSHTLEQLKRTQSRMIQSEKMASVGLLAAGVAHEINNPAGFINTNISTMSEYMEVFNRIFDSLEELYRKVDEGDLEGSAEILKKIRIIESEEDLPFLKEDGVQLLRESDDGIRRIKDIVKSLSVFSRPESGELVDSNINDIVKTALKLTFNELKYKCEVITDLGTLPTISCKPDQLTQVLINLLVNAGHAIEEQGTIHVETKTDGKTVSVRVSDNGKGIDPENLNRLFDPFFTTKDVGKGTGLGLYISNKIVENHNGTILVDSTPGEGTSFVINLPREG